MSFFRTPAFTPTPGTAYEAFDPKRANPMIPQAMYRPEAAGPAFLAGLGKHSYYAPLRQMRQPLRGFGDPLTDLLGGGVDKMIEAVIIRSMPIVQAQLKPTIQPLQIMIGVAAVASLTAAVFSVLQWKKT